MSITRHIIHFVVDRLWSYEEKLLEQEETKIKNRQLMEEEHIQNNIKRWINNDIPIPKALKQREPYFVAGTCFNTLQINFH